MRQRWSTAAVCLSVALGSATAGVAGSTPGQDAPRPSLPDERFGVRTAPILLLSRPDVRADLGLTAQQAEDAAVEMSALYGRAVALKGKVGQQAVEARRLIDQAQRAWVETHLTAEQLKRLVQIDLQWEGPSALLSRPVVSDTLRLTAEQRLALKQAVAARDAARARGPSGEAAEHALALQTLNQLTPEQRATWRAMLGKRFVPQVASAAAGARPAR